MKNIVIDQLIFVVIRYKQHIVTETTYCLPLLQLLMPVSALVFCLRPLLPPLQLLMPGDAAPAPLPQSPSVAPYVAGSIEELQEI